MTLTTDSGPPRFEHGTGAHARWIESARRVRWDIERDLVRGRSFDTTRRFLPDGLSKVGELPFLAPAEQRLLSQLQGRTYARLSGLLESAIGARMVELAQGHRPGNPVACEALTDLTGQVAKHRALFGRLEQLAAACLPAGHTCGSGPDALTRALLAHSTWAVLGLALGVEISSLAHYRSSLEPAGCAEGLDPLWADVFHFHWKEASQHAILDELEWRREHARLDAAQREQGVADLLSLVATVDGIVVQRAAADAGHFLRCARRDGGFGAAEAAAVHDLVLRAYRGQHVLSGAQEPRFTEVLKDLATPAQRQRLRTALMPIVDHVTG